MFPTIGLPRRAGHAPRGWRHTDSTTFEARFLPHLDAAYGLAFHLTRDRDEAEDAVQEAFLRAWRHVATFRGEEPRAWLLAIVRRCCYTRWRRNRAGRMQEGYDEGIHALADESPDPEHTLLASERAAAVRRSVDTLPEPFREVILLREMQGLSYKQIGEVIGAPVGTVMSRLARARERLARLLAPELGEGA